MGHRISSRVSPSTFRISRERVVVAPSDLPRRLGGVERCQRSVDHHPDADHVPRAATLRSPAPGSRPTHRRPDHRHRSRGPALEARGRLRATPRVVVTLERSDLTEPELRQEIRKLRRRVEKLAALLQFALALLHPSGSDSPASGCPTDRPSGGFYAPWIERAGACHRAGFSGSCVCRRVGFRRGANGTPRVRSTIRHRALAPHRID